MCQWIRSKKFQLNCVQLQRGPRWRRAITDHFELRLAQTELPKGLIAAGDLNGRAVSGGN
jgi:hypothetical protein